MVIPNLRGNMERYIKNLGILVGKFTEQDLKENKDKEIVNKAMNEYNLHYTNTRIIKEKGIKKLAIYICNVYDFKI